jgi:hypothetical protein
MPSTSAKQSKFMRAIANNPAFAKKVGVKRSVGKDFEMADKKAKKFGSGGTTAPKPKPKPPEDGTNGLKIPPGGYNDPYEKMPPKLKPEPRKPLGPMGKKGYASGGVAKVMPTSEEMGSLGLKKGGKVMKKADKAGRALVKKSADTMGRAMKFAKGGGIETKGKTKGKMLAVGGVAGKPEQTGLARAAAMSGRTMPTTGRPGMKRGGKC